MRRKIVDTAEQQSNQSRQMRKVARDCDISRFRAEPIMNPLRWIVGLHVAGRSEFRQRIAGTADCLSRLLRAQLAAVPDDERSRAA